MPRVESFEPVIGTDPEMLILGSMPGVQSLHAQQYYAHPRNAFWPIMSALFAVDWAEDYQQRIKQFKKLPLALWDVLGACHRQGSLDADIRVQHAEVNRIDQLLTQQPGIKSIVFNGATAEKIFRQRCALEIPDLPRYRLLRLPSTSPAHAAMSPQLKLEAWRVIRQYLNNRG